VWRQSLSTGAAPGDGAADYRPSGAAVLVFAFALMLADSEGRMAASDEGAWLADKLASAIIVVMSLAAEQAADAG
jgi:hypothetical protein